MKTWATLAAAAALTIGSAAHAGEPLKLDNAALDSVTAGMFFRVDAGTFGATAAFSGAGGSGSTQESSYAFGERKLAPSSINLLAKASGQSLASGRGVATATGGGFVSLFVFSGNPT